MGELITKEEVTYLLSKIESRKDYDDVMALLNGEYYGFPFSDEEMHKIASKARADATAGKGILIEEMRNLHPRV
jgi:hypothetical protein